MHQKSPVSLPYLNHFITSSYYKSTTIQYECFATEQALMLNFVMLFDSKAIQFVETISKVIPHESVVHAELLFR